MVPGGGVTLVRAIAAAEATQGDNEDQNVGIALAVRDDERTTASDRH